ncbi:MAG: ATP-binding protein [Bacteroidota bacterium]
MIARFWNWVSYLGTSEHTPEENTMITLYNRMSLLSALVAMELGVLAVYFGTHIVYLIFTIVVFFLYAFAVVLSGLGKIYTARVTVSVGSLIWICLAHLTIAGFFSQSLAISASMAIAYVAFQNKPKLRVFIIAIHPILFFSSIFYVNVNGAFIPDFDFPFDEFMIFLGAIGWLVIVVLTFHREREQLIENLKRKNEKLQTTSEELERFTYIASHDLKTPLRTITSFIGLMERDIEKGNYQNLNDKLHFVKSGAKQMNYLIRDILELSQLKQIDQKNRVLVNLDLILEKVKTNLLSKIEEKNAVVRSESLPNFYGNETEFLLLFQNFIHNAIQYNVSEKPTVIISGREPDGHLELVFKDNGIGIAEEYHQLIFQFFKRLHNNEEYQGTGLGLGLCKKIIDNYEGTITLDSTLGEGTTFFVRLPIKAAAPAVRETTSETSLTTFVE